MRFQPTCQKTLRNSDVSSLSTTDDTTELYLSVSKIKATLAVGNYSLSNIGGLFVYSSDKDLYKSLLIQIRGYCYEYKKQVRIHLTHIDSGIGFDENYLELYNHITDHPEIHEKGRGIGLYNTAMRLNLTFNESAHIEFSNEPGLGARVDFDFPYFAYEQEELPQ